MDIVGKKVCVVGLGKSGISAIKLLKEEKAIVYVYDDDKGKIAGENIIDIDNMRDFALVVVSPAISKENIVVKRAKELGIEVISELELAYRFSLCDIIAVTGTNGKTTTTSIINTMIKYAGQMSYIGGNIGVPFCDFCKKVNITDAVVLEVSSFQLERTYTFHPHIAVLLNITPDHLNRHGNMDNYISCKRRLFANMVDSDYIIANYDDENVKKCLEGTQATILWISNCSKLKNGLFLDKERYIYAEQGRYKPIANMEDTANCTNIYNIMSVYLVAILLHISIYTATRAIKHFVGGDYLMKCVGESKEVKFFNDSKATNIASAVNDASMIRDRYCVVIGGESKGEDYSNICSLIDAEKFFIIGQCSEDIILSAKKYDKKYMQCDNLKQAILSAYEYAKDNSLQVVLLPAAASFDMFEDYRDRGNCFNKIVNEICLEKESL